MLLLLHVKAAFALGLLAGLFEFIPTVGPLLSAVPGVAMGFLDSPEKAATVALAYWGIQFLENHILIPLLMKGGMDLPPALTVITQALLALVFGFLGLMVAVPLLATVMVIVQVLYVEQTRAPEQRRMATGRGAGVHSTRTWTRRSRGPRRPERGRPDRALAAARADAPARGPRVRETPIERWELGGVTLQVKRDDLTHADVRRQQGARARAAARRRRRPATCCSPSARPARRTRWPSRSSASSSARARG